MNRVYTTQNRIRVNTRYIKNPPEYQCSKFQLYLFHTHTYAYPEGSLAVPPKPQSIDNQPLLLNEESQLYNIRKLTELPYCLARCKREKELKELLTDYDWLKASILTTSCADVISTFLPVLPVVPLGRYCTIE